MFIGFLYQVQIKTHTCTYSESHLSKLTSNGRNRSVIWLWRQNLVYIFYWRMHTIWDWCTNWTNPATERMVWPCSRFHSPQWISHHLNGLKPMYLCELVYVESLVVCRFRSKCLWRNCAIDIENRKTYKNKYKYSLFVYTYTSTHIYICSL